jgi:hypothetical protein
MSTRYSIAQRTPLLNSVFAAAACALTLTVTAGPAFAGPSGLERVEVRGKLVEAPLRYDVTANCAGIERQLQDALQTTWLRERTAGRVTVQFLMQGDEIEGVQARGMSNGVARSVQRAVRDLHCGPQATADARIYRFRVDFVDPYAIDSAARSTGNAVAQAQPAVRVALVND